MVTPARCMWTPSRKSLSITSIRPLRSFPSPPRDALQVSELPELGISQKKPEEVQSTELFPQEVVREALKRESPSIAFTYSEAITYYEYMADTARLGKEAGLKNVLVSNGYINREPLLELCKVLDGANINLKILDDRLYRPERWNAQPVLNTLQILHEQGVWLEITTLVVPTYVEEPE